MTDDQHRLDEFESNTEYQPEDEPAKPDPVRINTNPDSPSDDSGENASADNPPSETQTGSEQPEPTDHNHHEITESITTDDELKFGIPPEEFDINSKWARRYLAHATAPSLTRKTLQENSASRYETSLREWVNYLHAHDETVLTATFDQFLDYLHYCIELGRRTNTILLRCTATKGLYKHIAITEADLDDSIEANIQPLRFDELSTEAIDELTTTELDRTALSKEQVERLFDAMDKDRDRLMAITAVETGFRNSDVRGIRLIDIDLDEPNIKANDPKYGNPYTVPISEELALELTIWIEDGGRDSLLGEKESDYLFPGENGGMLQSNNSVGNIIKDAADAAGIQSIIGETNYDTKYLKTDRIEFTWSEVVPHVLRHTFITLLEKEGVPLEYRRLLANHESAETTRNYSHGKTDILKEAQGQLRLDY